MAKRGFAALAVLCLGFATGVACADTLKAVDCGGCHQEEHRDWQQSHHAKAMQVATDKTVLGRFDGSATVFGKHSFRFYKQDQRFQVSIQHQDSDGPPQILDIPYTFGISPLQQYLASLPKGKLQALPVAWDARSEAEGGQRWYALESDLEWDHPGFTWNTSCAECHSTGLKKQYSAESGYFDTTWDEINVACASCHGKGDSHQRWLQQGKPETEKHAGFPVTLVERGQWQWLKNNPIARRDGRPAGEQLSTCGQCHSRRDKIAQWHPGTELLDHAVVASVTPPLYFADGQIRDEVFALGSFMQSRMHRAGVVCSNCHQPHSLKLRAEGDALCAQCHQFDIYSGQEHHGHSSAKVGCVDCHMPATVYMGVDVRRDHRFGIPDPELSASLGSPDPCGACHDDKSETELAESIRSFKTANSGAAMPPPSVALTRLFAEVQGGGVTNAARYKLDSDAFSPVRQAGILTSVDVNTDASWRALVESKLHHSDAVVRLAAVRSLSGIVIDERWALLSPLINDPVRAVRFEVAAQLASAKSLAAASGQLPALEKLHAQYEQAMQLNLDSPTVVANFANFYAQQHKTEQAQALYQRALRLDAEFLYPYFQLAELSRMTGADDSSEKAWLDAARAVAPQSAELHYRYGLYWVRTGRYDQALEALAQAHNLAPTVDDFAMTYAVALESTGRANEAISMLASYYRQNPAASTAADLLIRYALKYHKTSLAKDIVALWLAQQPGNAQALRWQHYLQQQHP